jgi:putative zinc finger/helix-turn-helix YgiT family protein
MKCPSCGAPDVVRTSESYKYEESGLPNVTLIGIEVRRCESCGERAPVIPRITELHRVLSLALISKHARFTGAEIRFLRKYLGHSGEKFAAIMGVDRATLSRWETEQQRIGPSADRLIRLLVDKVGPDRSYDVEDLMQIEDEPKRESLRIERRGSSWHVAA